LIAGDPDGEVTLAWTVAQDLMNLYRLDDPDQAHTQAEQLISDLRDCPIPEQARPGRTCTPGALSYAPTSSTPPRPTGRRRTST